jgi:L-lactate utilization protein LutB
MLDTQKYFSNSLMTIKRIGFQRNKALLELDKYLVNVSSEFFKRGIEINWANNNQEKQNILNSILEKSNKKEIQLEENIETNQNKILLLKADYLISDTASFIFLNNTKNFNVLFSHSDEIIIEINIDRLISGFERINEILYTLESINKKKNYNIFSPKEKNGIKTHIILHENNTAEILEKTHFKTALSCIHCDLCKDVCPVLKQTNITSKPIDFIKEKEKQESYLSFDCTLCELCTENCPSGIKIHELLVYHREELLNNKKINATERNKFSNFKKQTTNRKTMNTPGIFQKSFTEQYYLHIQSSEKENFNKQWREKKGIK